MNDTNIEHIKRTTSDKSFTSNTRVFESGTFPYAPANNYVFPCCISQQIIQHTQINATNIHQHNSENLIALVGYY